MFVTNITRVATQLVVILTLSGQERRGGGGGAESARADFNLQELPCYISKTYNILPLLLKFIGEQDSTKLFLSRV